VTKFKLNRRHRRRRGITEFQENSMLINEDEIMKNIIGEYAGK
jgi:hypothetical protein